MKNVSTVLSTLAFIGVIILFCLYFSQSKKSASNGITTAAAGGVAGGRIAFVNIDSLEAHSTVLKARNEEFKKKQEAMNTELQRSYQQMQNDATELQKKAQSNALTQAEGDAAQKRLQQMQQSLESRKEALSDQLMKEQEEFSKDIKRRLDQFLENYNRDKHYDYIMSYTDAGAGRALLYANKQYDITSEVIKGMNSLPVSNGDNKGK
jgi:outer membrane protein